MRWTNRTAEARVPASSRLGNRRPKVTATFFNAKYIKKTLVEGTRVMLSGEVGYFKGTMQLTHPAFLILESPSGQDHRHQVAARPSHDTAAATGDELLSAFERDFFPIYPASAKVQSWDIYACVRQVLDVLDPVAIRCRKHLCAQHDLISEDERCGDPPGRERGRSGSRATSG